MAKLRLQRAGIADFGEPAFSPETNRHVETASIFWADEPVGTQPFHGAGSS